ncbi:SDR family NAD(P)-dependent oxidoreductase [Paenibacillus daejeonensis]|uniref:SDR family NAD(P)-dependent oxidoreductase n=1 Tax=Paenibacillus daejeonensis TaxID=135193 RepID=UPI000361FE81|nr:SDR family NAD(P)-dependent oxidoreductase [Paenibacillus daejeonensis]
MATPEKKTIVVIGAEHPLGEQMCAFWLAEGWTVFAAAAGTEGMEGVKPVANTSGVGGEALLSRFHESTFNPLEAASIEAMVLDVESVMDHVDMIVHCALRCEAMEPGECIDSHQVMALYTYNAVAPLRITEALLPLMEGGRRRIGFITDSRGGMYEEVDGRHIGYDMSLAALRMGVKNMSNALGPEGFAIRTVMLDMQRGSDLEMNRRAQLVCQRLTEERDEEGEV